MTTPKCLSLPAEVRFVGGDDDASLYPETRNVEIVLEKRPNALVLPATTRCRMRGKSGTEMLIYVWALLEGDTVTHIF